MFMKVTLNGVVMDIENMPVTVIRYIDNVSNEIPQKFCNIIYTRALLKRTTNDEDTMKYYNLATKMYNNSQENENTIEISKDEFKLCNELLRSEKLIIKARFLEMAKNLNPELFNEDGTMIEETAEEA